MNPDSKLNNNYLISGFEILEELHSGYEVEVKTPDQSFKAYIRRTKLQELQKTKLPVRVNVESAFVKTRFLGTLVRHTIKEVMA